MEFGVPWEVIDNSSYLLSTYYVLGTVQSISCVLLNLILTTTL